MKINFKCNQKFQFEKNSWLQYLRDHAGFKQLKSSPQILVNGYSVLSNHPEAIKLKVDLSQFPHIEVQIDNVFFTPIQKKELVEDWCVNIEEEIFCWSNSDKVNSTSKISYLSSSTIGGIAEFVSRLVVPVGVVIFVSFFIYTIFCFFLIKGIIGEVQYAENLPPTYLSYSQLKPNVFDLYQSNYEIMKGAILLALLSGGFFLGAQQTIICLLLKFCGRYFKKVTMYIVLFSFLQGLIYFDLAEIEWLIFFIPTTFFSYFLFNFFSRKLPYFKIKRSL